MQYLDFLANSNNVFRKANTFCIPFKEYIGVMIYSQDKIFLSIQTTRRQQ